LAIVTDCGTSRASEVFRRERLLWVTSNRHSVHLEEPLPLALGRPSCGWRRAAIDCLETMGRPHHIAYTSANASGGGLRRVVGIGGFDLSRIGIAARQCACSIRPTVFRNCRAAASDSFATA